MKVSKSIYIFFILFILIVIPCKVSALSLSIDSNGNVSRNTQNFGNNGEMTDATFNSYFDFDGDTLTLNNTNEQYFLEINKDIKITSTTNVVIGMSFIYSNITIESNYNIVFNAYDKTNSKSITLKNSNITIPQLHNFKNVIIDNCHNDDGNGVSGVIHYDSNNYGFVTINNSTYNGELIFISELHVTDSEINSNSLISQNNLGLKMNIDNSKITGNTFLIDGVSDDHLVINDSEITFQSFTTHASWEKNIFDITNSKFNASFINYLTLNFKDSEVNIGGAWAKLTFDNCNVTIIGSGSYKEIHAKDSTINADYLQMLGHDDDKIILDNTKVNSNNNIGSGGIIFKISNKSEVKTKRITTNIFNIDDSAIEADSFASINSDNKYCNITNSNLNIKNIDIRGGQKLDIDNSYITSDVFEAYTVKTFNLNKSKIIVNNNTYLKYFDFNHSYFLVNNTTDDPATFRNNYGLKYFYTLINKMPSNVIATDLNNNFIDPIEADENHTFYNNVLLRDKVNITFKVVNGTWSDGSSDDIIIEKYAFDKLLEDEVPKNMIATEGFNNGKWDLDIVYDDLKDDYIYTYVFSNEDINEGKEEKKIENPPTGAFISGIVFIAFIISSIILFIYSKKKSKFTKI